jgi:putative membrane protein
MRSSVTHINAGTLAGRGMQTSGVPMRRMVIKLIALIIGFALIVTVVPGISRGGAGSIVLSALVYMVVNATAGRLLKFVTAPLALMTLGLWLLVINFGVLVFTAWLLDGLKIDGVWPAIVGTLWLSLVSFVVNFLFDRVFFRASRH